MRRTTIVAALVVALMAAALPASAHRGSPEPRKDPIAVGYGSAVSTVHPVATDAGLQILRNFLEAAAGPARSC